MKSKVTTKTTKRYRYTSFKAKIDDIKIEPYKSLETKAHQFVESSHFLASFEHWCEINITANFTEFADQVSPLVQTLPLILYHQDKIIDLLLTHIEKHDEKSLQPLLDLLAQFVHDLGPDFLKFYTRSVECLIRLFQASSLEQAQAYEWGFNCLAYIFKYLVRPLSQDLLPTFKLLFPLLHDKEFLARFSAEALSFLIRKCAKLDDFVEYTLQDLDVAYDGLQILYFEAIKSTSESLHSKGLIILRSLLAKAHSTQAVSLVCDILMDLIRHASAESALPLYELVYGQLDSSDKSVKIMVTLSFADSGRKIPDWTSHCELITQTVFGENLTFESVAYLVAVVLRNGDVKSLTQYHKKLVDFVSVNYQDKFLEFYQLCQGMAKEKIGNFGINKLLVSYINGNWKGNEKKLALFLLNNKDVSVPKELSQSVTQQLKDGHDEWFAVYWQSTLLDSKESAVLKPYADKLFAKENVNDFDRDVLGMLLTKIQSYSFETIMDNIERFKSSSYFIEGVAEQLKQRQDAVPGDHMAFVLSLTDNLLLPDRKIRYETMKLIIGVLEKNGEEVPELLGQCRIIEEIPLSLNNGRDLTLRVRKIGQDFAKTKPTKLMCQFVFKFLMGLLTVKFSPLWEGVFEILPQIWEKERNLLWALCFHFINILDNPFVHEYYTIMEDDTREAFWSVHVSRLNDNISNADAVFNKFHYVDSSLISFIEDGRSNLTYNYNIRSQALKVLLLLPHLAETHSQEIVPYLLRDTEKEASEEQDEDKMDVDDKETTDVASSWLEMDRHALLKIFAKFKNMNKAYKSQEIHAKLMLLLSSRATEVQKLALDALFAFKDPVVNKYRDNLKNLLDDTSFKDEMSKFLAKDSSMEENDVRVIMPFILRVLFGRAQTPQSSGIKKSRKVAVITMLPSLSPEQMINFFKLGSDRLEFDYFFENGCEIDSAQATPQVLRRMVGFISIVSQAIPVLGSKFPTVLESTINPLIYSLAMAQYVVDNGLTESLVDKIATNIRQQGLRLLSLMFADDTIEWAPYREVLYNQVIQPRLANFEVENLQQASSIMRLFYNWSMQRVFYPFLYMDEYKVTNSMLSLLGNEHAKESVVSLVLLFANKLISQPVAGDEQYLMAASMVCESALAHLPVLFDRGTASSDAVTLLMNLAENGFIEDNETKAQLIDSMARALDNVTVNDKVKVLTTLALLIEDYDCSWDEIYPLYKQISKLYKMHADKQARSMLTKVFISIGGRFNNIAVVGELLDDLNSFSTKRIQEYDFDRRLGAFKKLQSMDLTVIQWLPFLYNMLFFINDEEEMAIRTNATYTLQKFIDFLNEKKTDDEIKEPLHMLKDIVLPNLRVGMRKTNLEVQSEYINLLAYIVEKSTVYTDLDDMKILLFYGDEEANFFLNITHIQIHRRQRAIRRLAEAAPNLRDGSLSHYLIPMVEAYVFTTEEKTRNVANDSMNTIGACSQYVSWNQYKALFRRYVSMLKKPDILKQIVTLIVNISKPVLSFTDVPERDSFVNDVFEAVSKVLRIRDDETVVARIPLGEALVNLALTKGDDIAQYLPGILTSICQVLRSRSEELRDAVRKNLSKISLQLGPQYMYFMIKELKTALTRGSQIHVLGFTIHALLSTVSDVAEHGAFDDICELIVGVIMENMFGAAGQEKEADGYTNKMKEIKHNKSYDTAELLTSNITLPKFEILLRPIKAMLMERLTLKTQNKVDELLRHYTLGLNHNSDSSSTAVLALCHELYNQAENPKKKNDDAEAAAKVDEQKEFFLVNLNAKAAKVHNEYSLYVDTLKKFSLDLLRTAIARNPTLVTVENLQAFIPLLRDALESSNESVVIASLRVLVVLVKLNFDEESENIFKNCARKILLIIKDSPSTTSELVQFGLKYLSSVIRHKDVKLKDTALSYVLTRLIPDLNEPNKQGLAFNFLRALVSRHIVLPEMYDTIDIVAKIMVTNHAKEIRDISRSVYYQFLMEYDQSRGRLEKQFKFLVSNLEYPAQAGRQSVMELINLIMVKSGPELLNKLSSSFFVGLAGVSINDDAPRCREMASALITTLFKKLNSTETIDKFIIAWLNQAAQPTFLTLGLKIYKIYASEIGLGNNKELDELAMKRMVYIIGKTDQESDLEWDLIYTALQCFSTIVSKNPSTFEMKETWLNIVNNLLYPHAWVRLSAARLVNQFLTTEENKFEMTAYETQTIVYRLFHQLSAPSISETLGAIVVKTIVAAAMKWEQSGAYYVEEDGKATETLAVNWCINRAGTIVRIEDNNTEMSKKCAIQMLALLIQIMGTEERIVTQAETIILSLFNLVESDEDTELRTLALETLEILQGKLPTAEYTQAYSNVKQQVVQRRQDRRSKKAVLAVTNPEAFANRKLKKHARSREKRKHEKDENGYYRAKKSKTRR